MFGLMHTFAASPNKYRRQKTAWRSGVEAGPDEDDWDDDPNIEDNVSGEGRKDWRKFYDGFSRNPVFVCSPILHKPSQKC
jgi:hypothetical protein